MSRSNPLSERERAFEEVYFRKENERLLTEMRKRKSRQEHFEALSGALGTDSPALIDPLLDLGIREENVTALVLAPIVALAWADHALEDDERHSILKAKDVLGIDPESQGGQLLDLWLDHRPHESLLDAWAAYVGELCRVLAPEERNRLKEDTLARAERIATAYEKTALRGGGLTESERETLEKIEAAFS